LKYYILKLDIFFSRIIVLKQRAVIFFALIFLTSCHAGQDYVRPKIIMPKEFVSQKILKALNEKNKKEVIPANWWEGFKDNTLNNLVSESLANNFEIASAMAKVKAANARVNLSASGDSVKLGVNANNYLQEQDNVDGVKDRETTRRSTGGIDLSISPDVSGKVKREVEFALANLEFEREGLKGVVLRVSSEVAQEYIKLRGSQHRLNLLNESIKLQEHTLEVVKERYNSGLSPDLDVQRATASLETLKVDAPELDKAIFNSISRLANLAGKNAGDYKALLSKLGDIPVYKAKIPTLLPLEVLNMRHDIRQSEARLKQAIANIGIKEADYYPSFELGGQIGLGVEKVSSASLANVLIGNIGLLIKQAVFDGGARSANIEASKAQAEDALANYKQTILNASEKVENALVSIDAAKKRKSHLNALERTNKNSFEQAEELYKSGLIDFLDVIDSQRNWASSRQRLAAENANCSIEISKLFFELSVD